MTFVASIFGSGEARRGSIPRSGAVTEEQRSQNRKATQPSGRRFFLAQTSLRAPYRPLKGMRVARASSGPKIPRRKRHRIYEWEYLGSPFPNRRQDIGHDFGPGLCAEIAFAVETDRDVAGFHVTGSDDEHGVDLRPFRILDLSVDLVCRIIAAHADKIRAQLGHEAPGVIHQVLIISDREDADLFGREPKREVAGVMFDQEPDEAFVRAERR